MPWSPGDALKHTKKAKSPNAKKRWAVTADAVLARTGDEGKAVRIANGMMRKARKKGKGS